MCIDGQASQISVWPSKLSAVDIYSSVTECEQVKYWSGQVKNQVDK